MFAFIYYTKRGPAAPTAGNIPIALRGALLENCPMDKRNVAVIILAAGKGTRMKSDLPKVLHPFAGEPLVAHVARTAREIADTAVAVVGYKAGMVRDALAGTGTLFAEQVEQLGTAHAVMQARAALNGFDGKVVVLSGDVPQVRAATVRRLLALAEESGAAVTLLSAECQTPTGYGRIIRDASGMVTAIVEERDANAAQKGITEINGGIYAFDASFLWRALEQIRPANAQKEYYLTDVVKIALAQGRTVAALKLPDIGEIAGVNTVDELAALNRARAESVRA